MNSLLRHWLLYYDVNAARAVIGHCPWSIRVLARIVQKVDSAMHQKKHCPADKMSGKLPLRYPVDVDLFGG